MMRINPPMPPPTPYKTAFFGAIVFSMLLVNEFMRKKMEENPRTHFERLASRTHTFPSDHVRYLYKLRDEENVWPGVIYDIGSCVLHWTFHARQVWPDAKIIAFDGLREVQFLHQRAVREGLLHDYYIGILSDKDYVGVNWYENLSFPSGCSYYKEIGTNVYDTVQPKPRIARTLDGIVRSKGLPLPDLIKIDVQGAEIDILKGGRKCLANASNMLIELQSTEYNEGAWTVDKSLPFIEHEFGWKCSTRRPFSRGHPDGDYHFQPSGENVELLT